MSTPIPVALTVTIVSGRQSPDDISKRVGTQWTFAHAVGSASRNPREGFVHKQTTWSYECEVEVRSGVTVLAAAPPVVEVLSRIREHRNGFDRCVLAVKCERPDEWSELTWSASEIALLASAGCHLMVDHYLRDVDPERDLVASGTVAIRLTDNSIIGLDLDGEDESMAAALEAWLLAAEGARSRIRRPTTLILKSCAASLGNDDWFDPATVALLAARGMGLAVRLSPNVDCDGDGVEQPR